MHDDVVELAALLRGHFVQSIVDCRRQAEVLVRRLSLTLPDAIPGNSRQIARPDPHIAAEKTNEVIPPNLVGFLQKIAFVVGIEDLAMLAADLGSFRDRCGGQCPCAKPSGVFP